MSSLPTHNYLSPLPLPTTEPPHDDLGVALRKNEVFMDISNYSIGTTVSTLWAIFIPPATASYILNDIDILLLGLAIVIVPLILLTHTLLQPISFPVRFNRQRREVSVLKSNGKYWLTPWEQITAATAQASAITQGGKITYGLLLIELKNPDPSSRPGNQQHLLSFNCGAKETATALWEYIRTYMESGPDAVHEPSRKFTRTKGIFASYLNDLKEAAKRKGWFLTLLWDGFFGLFVFNVLLADYLERKKLYPLPDLDHPDIIEWSKPLPPEQWARPSAEFQAALAEYEARRVP